MKTGDIVFVRDKGLIPEAIRFFDHGRFDHVAFFVSDTKIIEAQYGRKVQTLDFPYTDYEIISTNPTPEQLKIIQETTDKFLGEGYDDAQILRLLIKLVFHWKGLDKFNTPSKVVCSELVGYYLVAMKLADPSVINMSPNELYHYIKEHGLL